VKQSLKLTKTTKKAIIIVSDSTVDQILWSHQKSKKPGFSQLFGGVSMFLEKTRFLTTHKTEETGFFAFFGWCIDVFGKNPVSGHTQNR
jgi:hypothetical protein